MAVLGDHSAKERARFLSDFAVTAKGVLMAVCFKSYAKFRAYNHASSFYPAPLHYTDSFILHTAAANQKNPKLRCSCKHKPACPVETCIGAAA
jgi:hypothetical protein